MVSETLQPLVNELPENEKHRLLEWLKTEVGEVGEPKENELSERLKGIINKSRTKNLKSWKQLQ